MNWFVFNQPHLIASESTARRREGYQTESVLFVDIIIMNRAEEKKGSANEERFQLMLMIALLLPSVSSAEAKPHGWCYSYATPEGIFLFFY